MKNKETVSVNSAGQLVDHYGDMLYRFALLRVGNEQITEDLVQGTFLAALKSQKTFLQATAGNNILTRQMLLMHQVIKSGH